jgi:hypothetical protein
MDMQGKRLCHSCAGVIIGRKVLLVDVAYISFGVAHKEFTVLDDLHAAALYACGAGELKLTEVACKLAPDFPLARTSLFCGLAKEGRWQEAGEEFAALRQLAPESPLTREVEARLEVQADRPEKAVQVLRKAIEAAPEATRPHCAAPYMKGTPTP